MNKSWKIHFMLCLGKTKNSLYARGVTKQYITLSKYELTIFRFSIPTLAWYDPILSTVIIPLNCSFRIKKTRHDNIINLKYNIIILYSSFYAKHMRFENYTAQVLIMYMGHSHSM